MGLKITILANKLNKECRVYKYVARQWVDFQYWVYRHINTVGEASLNHRSAILLLSVLMIFIEPNVKLTFGNASLAGLGISVVPPQTIPISLFLLALLVYRLIAFWASVLIENGTDSDMARRKAVYEFDPSYDAEEVRPHDMGSVIKNEAGVITYKWKTKQIIWEVFFPNALALFSLALYLVRSCA